MWVRWLVHQAPYSPGMVISLSDETAERFAGNNLVEPCDAPASAPARGGLAGLVLGSREEAAPIVATPEAAPVDRQIHAPRRKGKRGKRRGRE